MKMRRALWTLLLALTLPLLANARWAQHSALAEEPTKTVEPANGPDPELPRVSFVFEHPEVAPNHFEIVVDSTGRGSYSSHSELKAESTESSALKNEDLERTFSLSAKTRDRIFNLAKTSRYFDGDFDYTKSRVAFTGKKTLSYTDKKQARSTTFNWSENSAVEELGGIFLGISSTLESGWRLEQLLQHEKLALNAELARLEQSYKNSQTKEMQLIAEVLQRIANDPTVMVVARRRAERLLQGAR